MKNIANVSDSAFNTLEIIKQDVIQYITEYFILLSNSNIKQGGDEGATQYRVAAQASIAPYTVEKAETRPTTQDVEKMKEILSANFTSYFDECVDRFELIRPNNQIIAYVTPPDVEDPTPKVSSIRPYMLKSLVPELLNAYSTSNIEKIKLVIYSIIEWYLAHNKVAGIDLNSYNVMLTKIASGTDEYKQFIYELNSYLLPNSDRWLACNV